MTLSWKSAGTLKTTSCLFILIATIFILIATLFPPASCRAAQKTAASEKGWIIEQRADHFGKERIFLTAHSFKWLAEGPGIALMMDPSSNKLYSVNEKTHAYLELTADSWEKIFGRHRYKPGGYKLRKGKSAIIAGLRADQYFVEALPASGDDKSAGSHSQAGSHSRAGSQSKSGSASPEAGVSELWATPDIKLSGTLHKLISGPLGFPAELGLLLRMKESKRGKMIVSRDTLKVESVALSPANFKVPPGYRKVNSEVALVMENDDQGAADDLFAGIAAERSARRTRQQPHPRNGASFETGTRAGGESSTRAGAKPGTQATHPAHRQHTRHTEAVCYCLDNILLAR